MKMNGQWMGNASATTTDTTNYLCMLNLDLKDESYEGKVLLFYLPFRKVSRVAQVKINKNDFDSNNGKFTGKLYNFLPLRPENYTVGRWEDFPAIPKNQIPETGKVEGCLKENKVTGKFETDKKDYGEFTLDFYSSTEPSDYPSERISWEDFKNSVLNNVPYQKFIFRGQVGRKSGGQWRLRTSFHRTGRADLFRYKDEDIPTLYRYISAFPDCKFDLNNPLEYGALLALAQHHGYPTPLLDWTYSPYVAAYFAYADIPKDAVDGYVRVFIFDVDGWVNKIDHMSKINKKDFKSLIHLNFTLPSFSYLEPLSIGNNRMLPQQSVSMFSSIDDIEGYIKNRGKETNHEYLKIYDLPVKDRTKVIQELDYMDITAAALFPGLDGVCTALKEKYF
ncbi:MAG: FRG domain-containing protein [Planctomycetes bacterium]|uniref:FRG domain-containing protein n=1 Tax=Candidatus Wunengus sp. YC65 TaxID=3367701 RepID=UPI001D6ACC97|nr:FRG domain-containing protein [Planctomycetota bacterium]MBI5795884.1 FRG domain-containing protein [Planctomycetota bacterium]